MLRAPESKSLDVTAALWELLRGHQDGSDIPLQIVNALIKAKANVNHRNDYNYTPLHNATTAVIAQALIDARANVNARGSFYSTHLHFRCQHGVEEVVRLLLANAADVHSLSSDNRTPLHVASTAQIAVLLVEKGAKVDALDESGGSPLHCAAEIGYMEVFDALLDIGGDPTMRNARGRTPLAIAVSFLVRSLHALCYIVM